MWVKAATAATLVGLCAAGPALAGDHGNRYSRGYGHQPAYRGETAYFYAPVVQVEPLIHYVTVERPRRECWEEVVQETSRPSGTVGPTIAGGVVGAAVGRQFGGGSGRDALTVIGAVVGSAVANQRAVRNHGGYQTRDVAVQRCETVSERFTEQRTDGYLVTYRYQGRNYTMQTAAPPGDRVRLAVDVRPVRYRGR